MTEDSTQPPEPAAAKPARPVNRWGIGTLSALQVVLLTAILAALNYLGGQHYSRADLSRDGAYSLSPATTRYLTSEAVTGRTEPVKWIIAFRRGPGSSPFYERVRALAEEYQRLSGGKIELEIVDPLRSPDRTQQVTETYGLTLVRDIVIIDARSDDSAVTSGDAQGIRTLNPHIKIITADDLVLYELVSATNQGVRQRRPTGFQGEDVLTARLVEAIEGQPRQMLFIADKSGVDAGSDDSPAATLQKTLRYQNIDLRGIGISGLADIPEDAEGVAIVAPRYDFTEEEIAVLDRYWNRPRAALLVVLGAGETPPNLRAFLRRYGVTPRRDRVITASDGRAISTVRASFTYGVDFLEDLAGQATVFEGGSSSLEIRAGTDEELLNRRIFPMALIEVAAGYWGETKFAEGSVAFDEREDHKGPLFLAAGVIRGAASDDRFAGETSRMMIISNADFLDPSNQRAENLDFLASSVNWMVGRESLAGIGPRSLGTYKLPILDAQVSFINRVNLFFLPAFLLVIGGFVWSSRRA